MRAKSIENITNGKVKLQFVSGMSANLLPGSKIENVDITNAKALAGKALVVKDLTEVTRSSGKTQING